MEAVKSPAEVPEGKMVAIVVTEVPEGKMEAVVAEEKIEVVSLAEVSEG